MSKNIVYFKERQAWRKWLEEHFETDKEVWFTFPTVNSGEKGVSYNDAVEEALCFGWIDGVTGTLDKTHQLRRFTPRRKDSGYSQLNIERLIVLDKQGMVHPKMQESVKKVIEKPFVFPKDIIKKLQKDEVVWNNYLGFTDSYKRIRIAHIDSARKRPAEFKKRLENFIKKTRENKIVTAYGGSEKYYK